MEDKQETLEHETKLSSEEMKLLVVMGRALADPTRTRILGLLAERPMYGLRVYSTLLKVRSTLPGCSSAAIRCHLKVRNGLACWLPLSKTGAW